MFYNFNNNFNILNNNNNNIHYNNNNNIHYNIHNTNYNNNINLKKNIFIIKYLNYKYIQTNHNINIKKIYFITYKNNFFIHLNQKYKNFITNNINSFQHIRAIPVIYNSNINNNIASYIQSLENDNDYLNKLNILLKYNS